VQKSRSVYKTLAVKVIIDIFHYLFGTVTTTETTTRTAGRSEVTTSSVSSDASTETAQGKGCTLQLLFH